MLRRILGKSCEESHNVWLVLVYCLQAELTEIRIQVNRLLCVFQAPSRQNPSCLQVNLSKLSNQGVSIGFRKGQQGLHRFLVVAALFCTFLVHTPLFPCTASFCFQEIHLSNLHRPGKEAQC